MAFEENVEQGSKQTLQIADLLLARNANIDMLDTTRIPDFDRPGETKPVCPLAKQKSG